MVLDTFKKREMILRSDDNPLTGSELLGSVSKREGAVMNLPVSTYYKHTLSSDTGLIRSQRKVATSGNNGHAAAIGGSRRSFVEEVWLLITSAQLESCANTR